MSDEKVRMYGDYLIVARDTKGKILKMQNIEGAGSFTIEDILANAYTAHLDTIEIKPQEFYLKRGDEVIRKFQRDHDGV